LFLTHFPSNKKVMSRSQPSNISFFGNCDYRCSSSSCSSAHSGSDKYHLVFLSNIFSISEILSALLSYIWFAPAPSPSVKCTPTEFCWARNYFVKLESLPR
jgi:hypothetical protein